MSKSTKIRHTSGRSTQPNVKRTYLERMSELRNSQAKVRFKLPDIKIRTILENYCETKEPKEFLSLVCSIRDADLMDNDVEMLTAETSASISLVNRDLRLFIEAMLSIRWTDRDLNVIKKYQKMIVKLLSAHNYFAKTVINKLVQLFIIGADITAVSEEDKVKCQHVHYVLNVLLQVVPMCKETLLCSLTEKFPYYTKPSAVQEFYIYNLLQILEYHSDFKLEVLWLIFKKLILMDVNSPKESIEIKEPTEDIFEMDKDEESMQIASPESSTSTKSELSIALDNCMNIVLEFILKECRDLNGDVDGDKTKNIYKIMLTIFDEVILPTYNAHHVQFVMFVICGLKSSICELFLNYLWTKACNPNIPIVIRQAVITYIASLIARGLFISQTMLKCTLQQMSEWIHTYSSNQDGLDSVNSDVRLHAVFYSMCQALFYIIAFRYKDLVARKKDMIFLQNLQLAKIVNSRLNPLRVCQPAVVQNFATITRKYQLVYCYTIIDHNTRNTIPIVYQDGSKESHHVLPDFFPFDPYVLQCSGEKIYPLYRNYEETNESATCEINLKENLDEDDFLENVQSVQDTSPCNIKNLTKFSYGSSPGFKFKSSV